MKRTSCIRNRFVSRALLELLICPICDAALVLHHQHLNEIDSESPCFKFSHPFDIDSITYRFLSASITITLRLARNNSIGSYGVHYRALNFSNVVLLLLNRFDVSVSGWCMSQSQMSGAKSFVANLHHALTCLAHLHLNIV